MKKENNIEKIDFFIDTIIRSYLTRNKVKNIIDLPEDKVINVFEEMKKMFIKFDDYNEEIDKRMEARKNEILETKRNIEDEKFQKRVRKDRSNVEQGYNPKVRLKAMSPDFEKMSKNIEVESTIDTSMIKIKENVSFSDKPETMNIKDVLKVEEPKRFSIENEKENIEIIPVGAIEYCEEKMIHGKVQKIKLKIKSQDNKKVYNEYIYTNSLDYDRYLKDEKYQEKVKYLLSKENLKGSKELGGYVGEINSENCVIDDEKNMRAVMEYDREVKESKSILDKIKSVAKSKNKKDDYER